MLNHIVIMGRLTRDPELKEAGNGTKYCNFSLAVDRPFKSASGERETDFIDCTAFRNTAEFVGKYLTKGRQVVVEGRLQIDSYTDKDGGKRKTAKIVVDAVHFADSRRDAAVEGNAQKMDYALMTENDGNLPF